MCEAAPAVDVLLLLLQQLSESDGKLSSALLGERSGYSLPQIESLRGRGRVMVRRRSRRAQAAKAMESGAAALREELELREEELQLAEEVGRCVLSAVGCLASAAERREDAL